MVSSNSKNPHPINDSKSSEISAGVIVAITLSILFVLSALGFLIWKFTKRTKADSPTNEMRT